MIPRMHRLQPSQNVRLWTSPPQTIARRRRDAKIHRRISMAEKMNASYDAADKKNNQKESNAERLRYILEEPRLRSLFREFLRGNFCEENLSFWLDVEDFKRKFNITSSAVAVAPALPAPVPRQHQDKQRWSVIMNPSSIRHS